MRSVRQGLALALCGGTMCLGLLAPAPAVAAPVEVGTFPVSFSLESPCTGEEVLFEGLVHYVGGDHFRFDLIGIGTSGAAYRMFSVDNEGSHATRAAYASTASSTQRIVREGGSGSDDWSVHATGHSTYDANGALRADFVVINSRCG